MALGVRNRDQAFRLRCAADRERAVEPSLIPVNTDLRSPHSAAGLGRQRWEDYHYQSFRYCLVQGLLGEGTVCRLIRV
jgi:hypothetical protein